MRSFSVRLHNITYRKPPPKDAVLVQGVAVLHSQPIQIPPLQKWRITHPPMTFLSR